MYSIHIVKRKENKNKYDETKLLPAGRLEWVKKAHG